MKVAPSFADIDANLLSGKTFVKQVEVFEELSSTNDHALQAAGERPLPRLIIAANQTAGRGRQQRAWWTGEGSLAASLVLRPAEMRIPPERVPRVALAVGAALHEACQNICRDTALGLCWPNDVYVGARKLAGVLCEATPTGELVIGLGVNVNNTVADAPPELRDRVVTLRDLRGSPVAPTEFLIAVLLELEASLELLARNPAELAARCDRRLLQKGRRLTVRCGRETLTGQCLGIAEDGALVLETAEGNRQVYAGSVIM